MPHQVWHDKSSFVRDFGDKEIIRRVIMKIQKTPFTTLFPVPAVAVTSIGKTGAPNVMAIAWAGTVCSDPPMVSISVRPSRHSNGLIKETGQFVINIPRSDQVRQLDLCGSISGRDADKFELSGFTPTPASKVMPPLIAQCPVNIECEVRQVIPLGAHDMFIGEIVAVHMDEEVLDERGRLDFSKMRPFAYNNAEYWSMKEKIGHYGFTRKE